MAARLSKADLTTRMVKEFTDLQGVVGGIYARREGQPDPVWQAIYDQYRPVSAGDDPPREAPGAIVWRIGVHPELPAYLAFATALVILSAIDIEHHRLPNKVLGAASVAAALLFGGAAAIGGRWVNLEHAALGAVFYGLPMLVIGLAAPSAMGGGDVKFAPYLGFHLGWLGLRIVLAGGLLGLVAGGLGGAAALLVGGKGMKDPIPFGPFMAAGALAAILLGHSILSVYVGG